MIMCTTVTELPDYEYIIHWAGAYLYFLPIAEYKKEILRGNATGHNQELTKILCFNALINSKFNTPIDSNLEKILREHINNDPCYDFDYFINNLTRANTKE